jgi:serine/threonine protein kinase
MIDPQALNILSQRWVFPREKLRRGLEELLLVACELRESGDGGQQPPALLLDGYQLDPRGCVGQGAYGAVFLVHVAEGPRALKLFDADFGADEQASAALMREVSAGIKLRSPYVARYDRLVVHGHAKTAAPICYLIREFIEGDLAHHSKLTEEHEVSAIFDCLAIGLHDIHGANVAHRDVRPGNAVMSKARASWIDLGTVGLTVHHGNGATPGRRGKRQPWIPPEAWEDGRIAYKKWLRPGDVFAFAATMFQLITGFAPQWSDGRLPASQLEQFRASSRLEATRKETVLEMLKPNPANRPPMPVVLQKIGVKR